MHASIWRYYEGFFQNFTEDLEWGDLNCLNQETILVDESLGISGYPQFGSPFYVGDKELECGFNVICTATNHMMDKGIAGIQSTLGYWADKDAVVLGVHADENEPHYAITEVNGVTFALFNYTYGTNGIEVPKEYSYMADVEKKLEVSRKKEDDVDEPLDEYEERIRNGMLNSRLVADIMELNDQVDVIIVFPHWGKEYRYQPTSSQKVAARVLAEAGADIIIGTHPHVIEPMEMIEADNGNECICYYSLGNFVHGQDKWERCLGAMAKVVVTKNWDGLSIEATAEPNVCHQYKSSSKNPNFYPFRLSDYTDDLAKKHRLFEDGNGLTVDNLKDLWNQVFGEETPKLTIEIEAR